MLGLRAGDKNIMATGVSTDDFTQILGDYGRTVSYKVVTRTTNDMTGEEITAFAGASNITAIYFLEDQRFIWDKSGLLAVGDAYLIVPTSQGAKRYDQFTIDSQTYYIDKVVRRTVLTIAMMDFCTCFKVA